MDDTPILTRRELLKRVTMVGTAVAIPVRLVTIESTPADVAALQGVSAAPAAFETLTAVEGETLQAIVARSDPDRRQRTRSDGGPVGRIHRSSAGRRPRPLP